MALNAESSFRERRDFISKRIRRERGRQRSDKIRLRRQSTGFVESRTNWLEHLCFKSLVDFGLKARQILGLVASIHRTRRVNLSTVL